MSVTVRLPAQLRSLAGGAGEVTLEGGTVGDVLGALQAAYPEVASRVLDDRGQIRRFVNVFVADEDIRFLEGLATPTAAGEVVSLVPAVAGG
ncbi:MAG: MoaD/ThiS family protein [Acidobacteriota bacterium]|nr:MoaD/ThiS family protein [Acidobacteriota bacterium]